MQTAPLHPDEETRLKALYDMKLLDTPAEERFERITRLAREFFKVPIALLTLIDRERQWFKSSQGLDCSETRRGSAICSFAILEEGIFQVQDTRTDRRFKNNPWVTEEPYIRFYAGYPLRNPDGRPIGTLCILDRRPRRLDLPERMALRDFAAIAEDELLAVRASQVQRDLLEEMDRLQLKSMVDPLTRAWNREAIIDILEREAARAKRDDASVGVSVLDLDHFKQINDNHGHPVGDLVLQQMADRVRRAIRNYDGFGRYGGEEFLLVLPGCDLEQAGAHAERVRLMLDEEPFVVSDKELKVTASLGVTVLGPGEGAQSAIARADKALYEAKRAGRNQVVSRSPYSKK